MTASGNIRNTGTHNSARYFGAKPCWHLYTNRPKLVLDQPLKSSNWGGCESLWRRLVQCSPDMELGHWVTGSLGHLSHLSRPGHRVIIFTRCETRVFPVFEKMPKMRNVHLKCWNDKSHCQVSAVELKIHGLCNDLLLLLMIITTSLTWEYFFVTSMRTPLHISRHLEFIIEEGHHSPGQLGLRVAGFPGH